LLNVWTSRFLLNLEPKSWLGGACVALVEGIFQSDANFSGAKDFFFWAGAILMLSPSQGHRALVEKTK